MKKVNWKNYNNQNLVQALKDYEVGLDADPFFKGQKTALLKEIDLRKKQGLIRKDAGIKKSKQSSMIKFPNWDSKYKTI